VAEQGAGGERFEGKIAGQSVSLVTDNLLPIFMLLIAGVGGYLVYLSQDKNFQQLRTQHLYLVEQCHETKVLIGDVAETMRGWFARLDYNQAHPGETPVPMDLPTKLIVPPKPPPVPNGPALHPGKE
jgi:hypothetical protein